MWNKLIKSIVLPEKKKQMFRGNQQTAQMMTTKSTSRVTFRFALIVSGRTLSAGLGGGMFETESFDPISGNYKTFDETLF